MRGIGLKDRGDGLSPTRNRFIGSYRAFVYCVSVSVVAMPLSSVAILKPRV